MPLPAILLSVLGLIPFIVCGLAALSPDAVLGSHMLTALIGYAAVTLSFAGGVHWGLALQPKEAPPSQERARLGFAVLPLLAAWLALLVLMIAPRTAVALVVAAYVGTALLERAAARRDLMPPRYLWLRWAFTIVAVAMLTTVLTLRLLGQTLAVF
jgi:amino acid transporter